MSLTTDRESWLVDVTRMPLSTLRTLCDPLLLDAVREAVDTVPPSGTDEIQEPGSPRNDRFLTD